MSTDYAALTLVATQVAEILCARSGKLLGREVLVAEGHGGHIEVTPSRIIINPFHFTTGNPIAVVGHALSIAAELDAKRERSSRLALQNMRANLRASLRTLLVYDPDAVENIIAEELSLRDAVNLETN